MRSIGLLMLVTLGITDVHDPSLTETAKQVVQKRVRFYKNATIEKPFYLIESRWQFPVCQEGRLVEVWCVSIVEGKIGTCGKRRPTEYDEAFFKYRTKIHKDYDLAMLNVFGCGQFWVVQKDLIAAKFIPVGREAWMTLMGKTGSRDADVLVGRSIRSDQAMPRVQHAAEQFLARFRDYNPPTIEEGTTKGQLSN
jgi:hypothetical protein